MTDAGQTEQTGRQLVPLEQVYRLAEEHRAAGRLDEAEALLRQVLEARPDDATALHLLGILEHQRGHIAQAVELVRRAAGLAPDVALIHANLGEMYRQAGQPEPAIRHGERALELQPDYPEALSNVGIAHYERRDYEAALACQRRAVELKPDFALAHSNLGNALYALKRFDEAVACYRRAVELAPGFSDGWSNLGTSLHHAGRYEPAIAALRHAIALDPGNANAHSGLGILLLMRGDLAEGWEEYEWRLKSTEVRLPYQPQRPWQGESLKGRHIYIHAEQGFGDTLQFVRYVPLVAARAARVTLRTQQGLAGLLRQSLPGIEVLGDRGATAATADCECALLSLPRLFGTRLETIPAIVPYLRADAAEAARWQARLASRPGLRVGLAWAGNPEHTNDRRRSVGLGALAPLFEVPGVSFVSLQVDARAADLERHPELDILDIAADLVGFAATAAAMAALDLVITIDSSVAHLAGALAKPTWLFMPWVSDWRWLLGREDSPWYPTMRLFRQVEGQPWAEIAERVAAELARAAAGDTAVLTPFREAGETRARQAAEIIAAIESRVMAPPPAPTQAPAQVLALAEQRRQAGKLAEAEMLARRVLDAEPGNAEAWHLLGIVAHQSGNLGHAISHVARACELAPETALYHANLGEMCRLAGRIDQAIAEARRALALQPDQPGALNNLAIALFERGELDEAVQSYERAIALQPGYAEAHSNLGNARRAQKRYAEAEPCYRRAIELQPGFPDAWNNLGTTLRDLKRFDEAEACYRKALELKTDDPAILNNLALALQDMERDDEAEALLQRSLAIEGENPQTLLYLAVLLLDRHRLSEALPLAQHAYARAPQDADVVNLMGRIAFERGELDDAEARLRQALALKPDLADAWNNLGNLHKERGEFEAAREAFLESMARDATSTGVYVNYADAVTFKADEPRLKTMEAMRADDARLSDTDRLQLDFALAKAYADLGDHERSFARLKSGNALKRAKIAYDEAAAMALFDRIEAVFTAELVAAKAALGGEPSSLPIFIIGVPRSGTTLIEQILASHPEVHGGGELATLSEVVGRIQGDDGRPLPYPELVPALDAAALREIGARYLAEVRELAPEAPHITDKMPSNFYFAGLIHLALPRARIIHAVRDPVDTCVSCFSKLFTAEQHHTYDLAELGRYHRRYMGLMEHWRRVLPAGRILDVRYEDVVADLEGQARRIVEHCGLAWDPRCLAFHETRRPVRTASASQVRRPLFSSSVGRGRRHGDDLAPLLAALGDAAPA